MDEGIIYSVGPPQDECEKFVMGDTILPDTSATVPVVTSHQMCGSGVVAGASPMLFSISTSECNGLRTARLALCLGQSKLCPEQSYTQRCNLLRRSNPATQLDALCCGLIATMSGALQRGGGSNLAVPTQTCGNSFSIYVVI